MRRSSRDTAERKHAEKVWELLVPLGFECQHMSRFKHLATGAVFDFSAINPELKDLLEHMLQHTIKLHHKKGHLTARAEIAELLNVAEELDQLELAELHGSRP